MDEGNKPARPPPPCPRRLAPAGDADPGAPSGDRDGRLWLERKERHREGGVPDVLGAQLAAVPDCLPWDVSAERDATAEHAK